MAKKVVRLTESALAKLIKRVILEQEIDYNGITDAMKKALIGAPTQLTPSGKSPIQFKITDVIVPATLELSKPRMVTLKGTTGTYTENGFVPSSKSEEVYITYRCATSSDKEKTSPITYQGKMESPQSVAGRLTNGLVNNIETMWCQKLPPMVGGFM